MLSVLDKMYPQKILPGGSFPAAKWISFSISLRIFETRHSSAVGLLKRYIKARGEGMSIPLDQFEVSFLPGDPPKIKRIKDDQKAATRLSIIHLEPDDGFIGALAVEGHPDQLKLFRW